MNIPNDDKQNYPFCKSKQFAKKFYPANQDLVQFKCLKFKSADEKV